MTGCATCGSTLRDVWPTLFDGGEKEQALDLSAKVKDAAEIIRVLSGYRIPRFKSRLAANSTVTYHYPCHSLRYPDAAATRSDMLKQVFGADYVELENTELLRLRRVFQPPSLRLVPQIGQSKIDSIRRDPGGLRGHQLPGVHDPDYGWASSVRGSIRKSFT